MSYFTIIFLCNIYVWAEVKACLHTNSNKTVIKLVSCMVLISLNKYIYYRMFILIHYQTLYSVNSLKWCCKGPNRLAKNKSRTQRGLTACILKILLVSFILVYAVISSKQLGGLLWMKVKQKEQWNLWKQKCFHQRVTAYCLCRMELSWKMLQ